MKLALWIAGGIIGTVITALGGRKLWKRRQEKAILRANTKAV